MDQIQRTLIRAGRRDLAQKYYKKVSKKITARTDFETIKRSTRKYDEELIAVNESSWYWEDDQSYRYALLFVDSKNMLRLVVVQHKIKTGLGAGEWVSDLFNGNVGTLDKPNLSKIRSVLKKHSHMKSRSGSGFKRDWRMPPGDYKSKKIKLADAINNKIQKAEPRSIVNKGDKILWNNLPGYIVKVSGDNVEIKLQNSPANISTNINDPVLKIL